MSEEPAIAVSAPATSPPVQDSAVATCQPRARQASRTDCARARGSLTGLALAMAAAAHQPTKKASTAATARPATPHRLTIAQANGKAASDPQLPGAIGKRPVPNQVASSTAGCRNGRPRERRTG